MLFKGGLMLVRTEAEEKAIAEHKRIVAAYKSGASDKKVGLSTAIRGRIGKHLLETGGGLTAAEIKADLVATRGIKWTPDSDDDGTVNIELVIEDMMAPGTSTKEMLESCGIYGTVDYSLASQMDREQYILTKEGAKYFLWCQIGKDWGAVLVAAEHQYEQAQEKHTQATQDYESARKILDTLQQTFPEQIDALETEAKSLEMQVGALSIFKAKQKKLLKKRLVEVKAEISSQEKQLNDASSLEKKTADDLADMEKYLSKAEKEYESAREKIAAKI